MGDGAHPTPPSRTQGRTGRGTPLGLEMRRRRLRSIVCGQRAKGVGSIVRRHCVAMLIVTSALRRVPGRLRQYLGGTRPERQAAAGAAARIGLAERRGGAACVGTSATCGLRKVWCSSVSMCHTASGSPNRIRNRSRIPSTAVATSVDRRSAQVRTPADVGQVPQVGVEVQPEPVEDLALLGHHEPPGGQQQHEVAGHRLVRTHAAAHQHGRVIGFDTAAEDRHVPAHGRDGQAGLGRGREERTGEHVHVAFNGDRRAKARLPRGECRITGVRRWLRSPFRHPHTWSAGRTGCRSVACGATWWS